jgi:predicted small lipoprotein YifL
MKVAMRRAVSIFLAICIVGALAGCGAFQRGPSYESAKEAALALRQEFEATLPDGASTVSEKEVDLACSGGAAQYDGSITVSVAEGFDRNAWLDEAAAMYADRPAWKVEKAVAADDSSDATSGVSFISDDGYYVRLDEFADTSEWGPVLVLGTSGPCVQR